MLPRRLIRNNKDIHIHSCAYDAYIVRARVFLCTYALQVSKSLEREREIHQAVAFLNKKNYNRLTQMKLI